ELETDHCLFGSGRRAVITKLNGLKSFLDGGQALAQAFLIAALSKRKLSRKLFLQGRKPARGILIALLVANLAMWISAVFESKRHISVEFHENYFGTKAWKIIKYTTLPMIIFFRFHSTVIDERKTRGAAGWEIRFSVSIDEQCARGVHVDQHQLVQKTIAAIGQPRTAAPQSYECLAVLDAGHPQPECDSELVKFYDSRDHGCDFNKLPLINLLDA
uniref:ISNCY family transposase n=1 Tax=Macrostomum lignano TaxID=282301 RepID=A0A1I8HWQ3_9PLAT